MNLRLGGGEDIKRVRLHKVLESVRCLDHRHEDPFLILTKNSRANMFMQTIKVSPRRYQVEYAEGKPQRQFTTDRIDRATVEALFTAYMANDESFKDLTQWHDITDRIFGAEPGDPHDQVGSADDADIEAEESDDMMFELAQAVAAQARVCGYDLDFSLESLEEVDRLIAEQSRRGKPKARGFFAAPPESSDTRLAYLLLSLGCYVGEVLVRELGGSWFDDTVLPDSLGGYTVELPNGCIATPVGKVFKRFYNGPEDSLSGFGQFLAAFCADGEQT